MGHGALDSVEWILPVEKALGIAIPDPIAKTLISLGLLHTVVVSDLQRLNRLSIDSARVLSELWTVICDQLGVKPKRLTPATRLVQDWALD